MYATKPDPFRAAHLGDVELLRKLLDRDCDVTKTRWSGWSLLHRAAEHGQTEVCEMLIKEFGADVNARSVRGWHTPLHLSLANGYRETSMLLVSLLLALWLMLCNRHIHMMHMCRLSTALICPS